MKGKVDVMDRLKHGGDIDTFAKDSGKDKDSIIDFSANVNPLGISSAVEKIYRESLSCISRYPDPLSRDLCAVIASQLSISPDCVITGNGAVSLIDLVLRAVRPGRALLVEPCFNEYRSLLSLCGAGVHTVALREEEDFNFSYRDIIDGLNGMDMLILGYPNNPTGTALKREEVVSLINETHQRGIFLLIDEAFIDWEPQYSVYQHIAHNPYLVVVRSLTKFFGLAGIRSGYALAAPEVISRLRAVQEPWSCNALAQRLSIAALQDVEFRLKSLAWFKEESPHMYGLLLSIPEIKVFPSLANFFLLKLRQQEDEKNFEHFMRSKAIYLRKLDDVVGLNGPFFRAALKDRKSNFLLAEMIKEALVKEVLSVKDKCLSL